jgi:hypothetical protein
MDATTIERPDATDAPDADTPAVPLIPHPAVGPLTSKAQRDLMATALGLARSHGHAITRNAIAVAKGSPEHFAAIALVRLGLMFWGADAREAYSRVMRLRPSSLLTPMVSSC